MPNSFTLTKMLNDGRTLNQVLSGLEKDLLIQAIEKTQGNRTHAALLLGIQRTTLIEKLRKYEIGFSKRKSDEFK